MDVEYMASCPECGGESTWRVHEAKSLKPESYHIYCEHCDNRAVIPWVPAGRQREEEYE